MNVARTIFATSFRATEPLMHRAFRQALTDATGRSEFVIVVVADIRGFSAFSKERESPDTAMYIKRVYTRLIDEYFAPASFYKPTGDGLLVTIPYTENNLADIANKTVDFCIACLQSFSKICENDNMINFPVPTAIGFGIARGTACCLHAGETILDYSGHLLNLSSRLMNLARPSGIVIDGSFKMDLLKKETKQLFEKGDVYLRGVAEEAPITIYFLKGYVEIPDEAKIPLHVEPWETWTRTETLSRWKKLGPTFRVPFPRAPKNPSTIWVSFQFPTREQGKAVKGVMTDAQFTEWEYRVIGGMPCIRLRINKLLESPEVQGLPMTSPVTFEIRYVLSRK
jgi:class 3 adenylate cyclase